MRKASVNCWTAALLLLLTGLAARAADQEKDSDRVAAAPVVQTFGAYGRSLTSAMIALADQTLAEEARMLKVLADTPAVRSGQWEKMRDLLKASQPADPLGMIWFARPDGSYYTLETGPTTQNLSDRPYFSGLMAGEVVPGSLVVSKATGKKSAVVAVPVREGNKVIGALGVSLFLDRFSQKIDRALSLPPSMVFYALSPDGLVALHRDPALLFEDPRKLGSETLRVAGAEMLSKEAVEVSYEFAGYQRRVLCQTSPLTHWRFALGINTARAAKAPEASK